MSAGVVQRLVCKFSKLEIGVRFSAPAPHQGNLQFFRPKGGFFDLRFGEPNKDQKRLFAPFQKDVFD